MAEEDEADDDLTDVAMDEALMLNQEPSPEYDVDDEQRQRISRASRLLLLAINHTMYCTHCLSNHCTMHCSVRGYYAVAKSSGSRYQSPVQILRTWLECSETPWEAEDHDCTELQHEK